MSFLLLNDLDLSFPRLYDTSCATGPTDVCVAKLTCHTFHRQLRPFSKVFTFSSYDFCSRLSLLVLLVSHQISGILNVHPQLKGFTVRMTEVFLKGAGPVF